MTAISIDAPPELIEAIASKVREQLVAELRPAAERWMSVAEAATYLACKPQRIYDLTSRKDAGRIPHRKEGKRLLFKASELDGWVEAGGAGGGR